jgi:hypothetical protein
MKMKSGGKQLLKRREEKMKTKAIIQTPEESKTKIQAN